MSVNLHVTFRDITSMRQGFNGQPANRNPGLHYKIGTNENNTSMHVVVLWLKKYIVTPMSNSFNLKLCTDENNGSRHV